MCALSHGIPSLPSFASCVLSMFPGISHTIHVPRFLLLFLSLPRSSTYISCLTIITPATATHLHTVHRYPTTNASRCAESPLSTKNTVGTHSKSLASLKPNHFYSETTASSRQNIHIHRRQRSQQNSWRLCFYLILTLAIIIPSILFLPGTVILPNSVGDEKTWPGEPVWLFCPRLTLEHSSSEVSAGLPWQWAAWWRYLETQDGVTPWLQMLLPIEGGVLFTVPENHNGKMSVLVSWEFLYWLVDWSTNSPYVSSASKGGCASKELALEAFT